MLVDGIFNLASAAYTFLGFSQHDSVVMVDTNGELEGPDH